MFIKYGLNRNHALWFHMLGGGVLALAFMAFVDAPTLGSIVGAVGLAGIAWETVELMWLMFVSRKFYKVYGNDEIPGDLHFLYDGLCDVVLAMAVAVMVYGGSLI